ncbi:MAG: cell division protein PerM [Streptosporangiaceae bacterium]
MTSSILRARSTGPDRPGGSDDSRPNRARQVLIAGARAAVGSAGIGLAAVAVLVLIGWIAAPHIGIGLAGALRAAVVFWLVAHHAGVQVHGAGRIGMLPLGLVLLPGVLLWRAGRVIARSQRIADPGLALLAVLAIAVPYGVLAGVLAVLSRSPLAAASWPQAVTAGFGVAFIAAGFGAARALRPWGRLAAQLPPATRSLIAGAAAALAVLAGAGSIVTALALAGHLPEYAAVYGLLNPGLVGGALLLLTQIGYLPNAIIWAIAYLLGPGFAVGAGTVVAPTGSALGNLPAFPLLAALPGGAHGAGPAWLTGVLMAIPYLAGAVAGLVAIRAVPVLTVETAPARGFATGATVGLVLGVLAAFSGGPLGDGRLSAVGPSAWQVALVGVLEIGISAAVAAGLVTWLRARSARVADDGARADLFAGSAGVADPDAAGSGYGTPPGVDITGPGPDAGGHVIYLDRWGGTPGPADGPGRPRGPSALP